MDRVPEYGSFSESVAAGYFQQMLEAISYCHSKGYYHRDLSIYSFLFMNEQESSPLIMTNLGYSSLMRQSTKYYNSRKKTEVDHCFHW